MKGLESIVRSERGFTLLEMVVATGLMLAVTATIFQMLNPSYGTFKAQPEPGRWAWVIPVRPPGEHARAWPFREERAGRWQQPERLRRSGR